MKDVFCDIIEEMIKYAIKGIVSILVNALAFFAIGSYVSGVYVATDIKDLLLLSAIFTVLYFILRPIVKMFLGPFIILTLGLGLLVVNAIMLILVDFLSPALKIDGVESLAIATIAISVINFLLHISEKND